MDPLQFQEPDVLNLARKPNLHLSFGAGEHRCLGQSIARLELQAMFRAILCELDELALDGPCVPEPSTFANSLASMPVTYRDRA
jgi:cytochrome P450